MSVEQLQFDFFHNHRRNDITEQPHQEVEIAEVSVVSVSEGANSSAPDVTTIPTASASVIIYCDGLCEPAYPGGPRNPGGLATWGWVAFDLHSKRLAQDCGSLGSGPGRSNNLAEYTAVIKALEYAQSQVPGWSNLLIRTDSRLVVEQVNGNWACHAPHLLPLRNRLRELLTTFYTAKLEWVSREQNQAADALTRQVYQRERQAKVLVPKAQGPADR